MRVGITQRVVVNDTYHEVRDALSHDWICYLEKTLDGPLIVPIPNSIGDVETYLGHAAFDLIILSNGNDVGTCDARDRTEERIYRYCVKNGVKLFGACRGLQFIGHMHGCRITQDLGKEAGVTHVARNHSVDIVAGEFARRFGADRLEVNSYHNQGILVGEIPETLRVFALSDSQVVEGVYLPHAPVIGVQWHPERAGGAAAFDAELLRTFAHSGAFWHE